MKRKFLPNLYAALCGFVSLLSVWYVIDALRMWRGSGFWYLTVFVVAALLFGLASVSILSRWRRSSWFAGNTAGLLILYALSVVLLGWEDVGGGAVAVPLALGVGLSGCLGAVVAWLVKTPNNSLESDAFKATRASI